MALTPAQLAFCTRYLGHGRAGRLAGTYELLEDIAALGVPDEANAEERAAVAGLAKNVRALLDDNASDKELTAAKGLIEQAEIKIREIGDRLDKARAAAATLHARYVELPKKLPEATPAETRKAFTDDVDAQLEALMGAPATATLRAAGDALPGFAQRIQDIKDTLAHEQEERNTKAAGLA